MSFLDMRLMRTVEAPTPSPDGKWLLYTLSTPDWKEAKSQTDIYLVSMAQGVASTRQMSYSKDRNEPCRAGHVTGGHFSSCRTEKRPRAPFRSTRFI